MRWTASSPAGVIRMRCARRSSGSGSRVTRPAFPSCCTSDAVIDSAENVTERLTALHGQAANALGQPRPDTDIYIDAAGVAAVINTTGRVGEVGSQAGHGGRAEESRRGRSRRDAPQ